MYIIYNIYIHLSLSLFIYIYICVYIYIYIYMYDSMIWLDYSKWLDMVRLSTCLYLIDIDTWMSSRARACGRTRHTP